jgi:hypothetical protein
MVGLTRHELQESQAVVVEVCVWDLKGCKSTMAFGFGGDEARRSSQPTRRVELVDAGKQRVTRIVMHETSHFQCTSFCQLGSEVVSSAHRQQHQATDILRLQFL